MFSLFSDKDIPTSLWDKKRLLLPKQLTDAHRNLLSKNGWIDKYTPNSKEIIGGAKTKQAEDHVINRFLNSAARMQYVCCDPLDEQPEVRDMLLDQLGEGRIYILDLGAGNGAGTLSALSMLTKLREEERIPPLPLNVHITGIDYSPAALNYYAEILDDIEPWLNSQGIEVDLILRVCDLAVVGDTSEALEEFLDEAKSHNVKRFLCVISAISGVKLDGMDVIHESLRFIAAGLSSRKRNTSWLWVEPPAGNSWMTKAIDSVRLTLKKIAHRLQSKGGTLHISIEPSIPLLPEPKTRVFEWDDPLLTKTVKSHVFVMAFKNE